MGLDATLRALRDVGLTGPEAPLPRGSDDPDLPVFLCFPGERDSHAYDTDGVSGCGAAFEETEARLKAVAECLESFCFLNAPDIESTRARFGTRDRQIDPANFLTVPAGAGDELRETLPRSELCWSEALDLVSGRPVELPAQLVFDIPAVAGEPQIRAERISSGMALGPSGSGMARKNGLLEILERDALMGAYLRRKSVPRVVGLPPPISDLVRQLEGKGVECVFLDVTSEIGIPTVAALCVDRRSGGPALTAGAACRETYADAAEKALLEAAQSRPARRALMEDGLPEIAGPAGSPFGSFERVVYWCDPANLDALDFWLAGDSVVPFAELAAIRVSTGNALKTMLARGWSVYEVDATLAEIRAAGFETKKIVCPDLHGSYAAEAAKTLYSVHYGQLEDIGGTPPHPFV